MLIFSGSIILINPGLFAQAGETTNKNLLINGDFEMGNTGFSSEYRYLGDTIYHGHYIITSDIGKINPAYRSPKEGDHTTGKGYYMVVDSKIFRIGHKSKFWISDPVEVAPHTEYLFSAWVCHVGGKGSSHPTVSVTINGQPLGPSYVITDQKEEWQQISFTWNSGKTNGKISVCMENIYVYQYVEDFAVDDIYFGRK